MVSSRFALCAATLLSSASLVAAVGQAIVKNNCNFPVYLWSVSNEPGPMQVLPANGGSYSEAYRLNPDGGGISIKLASVATDVSITQFEYTLTNLIYYDISNINGYPFMQWGMTLIPSDSTCRSLICPAGVAQCKAAYNTPDENYATAGCVNTGTDLVAVLCSGATDGTPAPSVSAVASAAAVSAAVGNKEAGPLATTAPATTLATSVVPAPASEATPVFVLEGDSGNLFWSAPAKKGKRSHRHHFHHHARS